MFHDWYNRTAKYYTANYNGRLKLDWDSQISDAYSSFFENRISKLKLMRDSYRHASDIRAIMDVSSEVIINIQVGKTSYSNGKEINVSTSMFDDLNISHNMKLDVFLGIVIHELSHVKYTDFEAAKNTSMFLHTLINVLEDERIEAKTIQIYPGYGNFLNHMKYYMFDKKIDYTSSGKSELEQVLITLFNIVRYPKYVNEEILNKHKLLFDSIHKIIADLGQNTREVVDKAYKIQDLLHQYFSEKEENFDTYTFFESLREAVDKYGQSMDSYNNNPSVSLETSLDYDIVTGDVQLFDKYIISKQNDNKFAYIQAYNDVRMYVQDLVKDFSRFFIQYNHRYTGMKRGFLDTNKLAEAVQSVENVYYNKMRCTTVGFDVCLLIDQSGSMSGNRIDQACKCTILLNEVFKRIPNCNFFIYGHTADIYDVETVLYVYKDMQTNHPYALGNISAESENRDSEAISEVFKLVRKQTKRPLLMFVISDGDPLAHNYSGVQARDSVRKVVHYIEKRGNAVVCQIAIDEHLEPSTMFKHYVKMTDLKTFSLDLTKYIMKTLISKLSRIEMKC